MSKRLFPLTALAASVAAHAEPLAPLGAEPPNPAFSVNYMDRSVSPGDDFYHYADGVWLKNNPIPPDKSRWASFIELSEHNLYLTHSILEDAAAATDARPKSPLGEVGALYVAAMDTNRIEALRFQPIADDLKRIDGIQSTFTISSAFWRSFIVRAWAAFSARASGPDERRAIFTPLPRQPGRFVDAESRLLFEGYLLVAAPGLSRACNEDVHASRRIRGRCGRA